MFLDSTHVAVSVVVVLWCVRQAIWSDLVQVQITVLPFRAPGVLAALHLPRSADFLVLPVQVRK